MCLETLGQFRSEENGSVECTSRQCRLKCDPGYQSYGAKSTVKCIRTKKVRTLLSYLGNSSLSSRNIFCFIIGFFDTVSAMIQTLIISASKLMRISDLIKFCPK